MASCLLTHQKDWSIDIPRVEEKDGVTYYVINVRVGPVSWQVQHRYREFSALHATLVNDHGISKDILPPKKMINKNPNFIEKRRTDLENYLSSILSLLLLTLPKPLSYFLDFDKYDVIVILQKFMSNISNDSCYKLKPTDDYHFQLIQVHAISERLKLPCPPVNMVGFQHDFSVILDFCSNLHKVTISEVNSSVGSSNINKSMLYFELSSFKSLRKLVLNKIDPVNLIKAEDLRQKLEYITVIWCELKQICDILLCDTLHRSTITEANSWNKLVEADFSHNKIEIVDDSLKLLPNIESLSLSSNLIYQMPKIEGLDNLQRLYLSKNSISSFEGLNLKFSKLVFLDLSQNCIISLKGLECLCELQGINLGSNKIEHINELDHMTNLQKLEYIVLTGNPLSTVIDYRVKILEKFGERASKICLDNEQTTQQELDTVAVLHAIRFVKEGKSPKTSTFVSYAH
ncbi:nischarin-like [Cimex lectularius]|uniref:PX domain-containing protein n=1 Tax=Cimex lectularius TaxID=79782 RepID=A0A8I6S0W3_CIMLE|nr:nischarin-like [Cimex lectularius]